MNYYHLNGQNKSPDKRCYVIKLISIMFFLSGIVFNTYAHPYLQIRIDLKYKDILIKDVFMEIEKRSDYIFLFSGNLEEEINREIDVDISSDSIEEILECVMKNTSLKYEILDKQIVVFNKAHRPKAEPTEEIRKISVQQSIKTVFISGKVMDEKEEPIVGANVIVPGTTIGTVTDKEGKFALNVPKGSVLRFSYIGYIPSEVIVSEQKTLNIRLKEKKQALDEVVVTGYANIRKESFTGHAISVSRDELLSISQKDVISTLQIFDPSLRYIKDNLNGANPNKLPEFYMRGQSGIGIKELDKINISEAALSNNPNLPIFIMDGYEVSVEKVYDYDPYQIKSLTILKDAAATAMYGSRAANGVIVIETIAPTAGTLRVNYNFVGSATFPDLSDYDLMNAEEKLEAERLAGFYDIDMPGIDIYTANARVREYIMKNNQLKKGVNTDWIAQPLKNVLNQKHSVQIESGDENIRLGLNLKYDIENGVMKKSKRERKEVEFITDYKIKSFQIKNKISYSRMDARNSPYGTFSDYTWKLPYDEIYDKDGFPLLNTELWHGGGSELNRLNPLYEALKTKNFDKNNYDQFSNNTSLIYRFLHFQIKAQFSIEHQKSRYKKFTDPNSGSYSGTTEWKEKGELSLNDGYSLKLNSNFIANYSNLIDKHHINIQAGFNIKETKSNANSENYSGFPSGSHFSPNYANHITKKPTYSDNHTRLFGAFSVINYSYNDIYLFDASLRIDGSSEFGTEKKYAPFWSFGVGINFHNYPFLKSNPIINKLKLSATTGELGKINFQPYAAIDMYKISDSWYITGVGASLISMGNPYLKWEITRTNDIMVDLGLFQNKFYIKFGYYNKLTSNLVNDIDLIASSGFTTYKGNVGKIRNRGIEIDIRTNIIATKDILVGLYGNFARNRNKIIDISSALETYNKLVNEQYKEYSYYGNWGSKAKQYSTPYTKYIKGGSVTSIFGMKSLGINPMDGKEIYLKKDGTITYDWEASEQVIIGDSEPKGQGAFGLNILYKGFSIYASFLYEFGAQEYNYTLVSKVENVDLYNRNTDKRVLTARWRQPGDRTTLKNIAERSYTTRPTSRFIQDYNSLSFNSLSIGYNFPRKLIKRAGLNMLKLSFNANSIGKLTTVRQERGLSYPFARSFDFTLNVGF